MRFYRISLILLILTGSIYQANAENIIKMGYFSLPPFHYFDESISQPKGAAIEYFNALALKMGYRVEWVGPLPLLRLSNKLENGDLDGTIGFTKFQPLTDYLYYTDKILYFAQPSIMVKKENPLTQIDSIEDIKGYRIGSNISISGYHTPLIDKNTDLLKLEKLRGEKWLEQNIKKLISERVDAVFDRQPYSMFFASIQQEVDNQIKIIPVPDLPSPMYVVFSKISEKGFTLLEQYNAIAFQFDLNYIELVEKEFDALYLRKDRQ